MNVLKIIFALILSLSFLTPCFAVEPDATSTPPPEPKPAKTVPAKKPTPKAAPSKLPGPPKITSKATTKTAAKTTSKSAGTKNPLRTEAELSGFSSETSDSFHSRLNLTKSTTKHKWWIKTDYGFAKSRTFGKKRVSESQVSGFNLDAMYRRNSGNHYSFVALIAGSKNRTPHSSSYYDSADFSIVSVGYGKAILPGLEFETSLAQISRDRVMPNKDGAEDRLAPLYTLRMKKPINDALTMDADVHLVEPWTDDSLVDSRMNLTYRLTPALSMRFTYVANNMLGANLSKREWDKSFRVSLVFAR